MTTGTGGAFTITLPGASLAGQFVSATATDAAGDTSQFAADVTPNTNPGVTINAPGSAVAGAPVSLTSTLSDTTKNKTYTYAWTVTQTGNPAFSLPAAAITDKPSLVFIPPTPGTYVAHLVVTDSLGGSGATASLSLLVGVPGPAVVIQGAPGNPIAANTTVSLTSAVSEPTGATPTSYTWGVTLNNGGSYSLPSGTPIHGTSFAFTPSANGLYQISLTVSDSAGGTTSTSVFVTVAASGQAATVYNVPRTGSEGTQIVGERRRQPEPDRPLHLQLGGLQERRRQPLLRRARRFDRQLCLHARRRRVVSGHAGHHRQPHAHRRGLPRHDPRGGRAADGPGAQLPHQPPRWGSS